MSAVRRVVSGFAQQASSCACTRTSLACGGTVAMQRRFEQTTPNKGYREQPPVPDRLKDTMAYFGFDAHNVTIDDQASYVPEDQRQSMMRTVMTSNQNLKNHSKLDRLRTALEVVRNEPNDSEKWIEAYMFMRTTELCCELVKDDADILPKGKKLWVQFEECDERRYPMLLRMPNGMIVMPVFSMEEYMDHYFQLTNVFQSCWFPIPRTGSRFEEFQKLEFPVGGVGTLSHCSTLATVSLPMGQFGLLINPGQRSSKFITYPEMVQLEKQRRTKIRDRSMTLKRAAAPKAVKKASSPGKPLDSYEILSDRHSQADEDAIAAEKEHVKEEGEDLFDRSLRRIFDTQKMKMQRVAPSELRDLLLNRPRIPQIAQLELQLLLHEFPKISHVFVRTVDTPRWKRMLGGKEKMTQLDIITDDGKPDKDIFARIKRWSFMSEFRSDVHMEFGVTIPVSKADDWMMCVYGPADGKMLRSMVTFRGMTLADALGFNEPVTDPNGREIFERY